MRSLLIVLDSAGVGAAPDAGDYGDAGANTLGHILEATGIELPALFSLGLGQVLRQDWGSAPGPDCHGSYGRMREVSAGKDTTTGHWEIAGVQLDRPFAVFKSFPAELTEEIGKEAGVTFIGNHPASGTQILEELGAEHCRNGHPILYTSADSVLQIAAHEEVIPPQRLYEICRIARRHCYAYRIGRVIARPFTGKPGHFVRTARRHDYSMVPPRTILNAISETGIMVEGIGKISDVYAKSGIRHSHRTASNAEGMAIIGKLWDTVHEGLLFANLIDFDMLYGHRRDVRGYADALVEFDAWLAEFLPRVESDDLVIITADHGNDPTFTGTDHTREEVPVLVKYDGQTGPLGMRNTFADIAATLAGYFHLKKKWPVGEPFFKFPRKNAHPISHRS